MEFDPAKDAIIREAALKWLEAARSQYPDGVIPYSATQIQLPETVNGQDTVAALNRRGGIRKPGKGGACLSLKTSAEDIYDDHFDKAAGIIHYKYREQGGYDNAYNRSIRLAREHQLPVLYFHTIDSGKYLVDIVRIAGEDDQGVILEILDLGKLVFMDGVRRTLTDEANNPNEPMERRVYAVQQMARVGQAEFRQRVMQAYRRQCTICNFKKEPLLEAAHIIPHAQEGRPEVPNGLSLCKIHHGAYDLHILGIDPDYTVHINRDMLEEKDGPMLKHGFQELNEHKILLPRKLENRPNQDNLAERFEQFRNAS